MSPTVALVDWLPDALRAGALILVMTATAVTGIELRRAYRAGLPTATLWFLFSASFWATILRVLTSGAAWFDAVPSIVLVYVANLYFIGLAISVLALVGLNAREMAAIEALRGAAGRIHDHYDPHAEPTPEV